VQSYLNYTQAEATSEAELKQLGVLLVEVRHPSFFPAFFCQGMEECSSI